MTEHQHPVGDPNAAAKRGIVLQIDGDRMLVQYYDGTKRWEPAPSQLLPPSAGPSDRPVKSSRVRFDDLSEQQFARLLDFYSIEWEYEPRTFEVTTSPDAGVVTFAPDFYLPAFDLYIEVKTTGEDGVTATDRLVSSLVEQNPGVSCKIIHQKDYLNLLTKYGLQDVLEPSGAEGADDPDPVAASRDDFKALITAA